MHKDMKVLIVDDFGTMLRILRNLLKQIGFHDIDEATDGEMAMGLFQKGHYDLVISDWNMKPVNGYDFLCAVRKGVHNQNVPFIMITAESKTEKVIMAKEAGVSNYIVKPFNADTLKAKITSAMGRESV